MNLFDAPLFPVRTASGTALSHLTLAQALRCKEPGQITHPMGYMAAATRMLAHAMTQRLVDHAGGIPRDEWLDAVGGGDVDGAADILLRSLSDTVRPVRAGFELFGDVAFMQAPRALFATVEAEPIEGLFQPFRARRTGDAKALRAPKAMMQGICQHCAAIGVFSTQVFSGSMAQYWGAAPTRGACVYSLSMGTVGASILANVMRDRPSHGESIFLDPLELPWVPSVEGFAGLEPDGSMPFEKHVHPGRQIRSNSGISFPYVRATRLEPSAETDVGLCDACGRRDQPLVRGFKLLAEPAVFGRVSPETLSAIAAPDGAPAKASGILQRTLDAVAGRHPALAYMLPKDKKASEADDSENVTSPLTPRPQNVIGSIDSFKQARPAWLHLVDVVAHAQNRPATIAQACDMLENVDMVMANAEVCLFGVRFEGSTNANPKFILDAVYGAKNFLHNTATNEEIGQAATTLVAVAEQGMDAWAQAAQRLEWDVKTSPEGEFEAKQAGSIPRRKAISDAVSQDAILRTAALRLWSDVQFEVDRLAEIIAAYHSVPQAARQAAQAVGAELTDLAAARGAKTKPRVMAVEEAIQQAKLRITASADAGWKRYLEERSEPNASFKQLYLEAQADLQYGRLRLGKPAKRPALSPPALDAVL